MILDFYPIEIRPPTLVRKTLLHTEEELIEFVNKYNGIKDIFVNLYHHTKSGCCSSFYFFDKSIKKYKCKKCKNILSSFDLNSAIVNCGVFDFDPQDYKLARNMKSKKMMTHITAKNYINHFSSLF